MEPHRVLRPARAGDLEPVLALLRAAGLPTDGVEGGLGEGFAVAAEGGVVVGAAGVEVHGGDGLLRSVVVAGGARGSGLGAALTRDRIAWAERRGLRALYLLTTTAEGYFPRLGFRATTRARVPGAVRASGEFRGACPASAAVLVLPLPGPG